MKKKVCSLLLALAMVLGLLPAAAFGAEETVTVTVSMDTQSVADDVTNYGLTALPETAQVTVPAGSTIAAVMTQWAADQSVDVPMSESAYGPYISIIGDFGAYGTEQFEVLCANAGYEPMANDIFQYAGWSYSLNGAYGNGIGIDAVQDGDTIAFRYGVYMVSGTWEQVDHTFLDAYNALSTAIEAGKAAAEIEFTDAQWQALRSALAQADAIKQEIDAEAYGLWFNYFAEKQITLWGPGSPTDKLQTAQLALTNALNKVVTPTGITFSENNIELPLNQRYTIPYIVDPEGASQDVTFEAFLGDDAFTVSDAGVITPSATNSLCWVMVTSRDNRDVFGYFRFEIVEAAPSAPDYTQRIGLLLEAIADSCAQKTGDWDIISSGIYETAYPEKAPLDAEARQARADVILETLEGGSITDATAAKAILALRGLGYDPENLTAADGTARNAVDLLTATTTTNLYNAPYVLLAYQQGDYDAEKEQAVLDLVLDSQNKEDGSWAGSPDTTGIMLAAIAAYAGDEAADAALAAGADYLKSAISQQGTYGMTWEGVTTYNADSTALAVIGLAAAGADPSTVQHADGETTILGGLLSYALEDNSGFGYTDPSALNPFATRDGFWALIAADKGAGYRLFDFTGNAKNAAAATPDQGDKNPDGNPGGSDSSDEEITVSFELKTHQATWIATHNVTVDEGATVAEVFQQVLDARAEFSYEGSDHYISCITYNGATWAEFDAGPNSGWKFMVNGAAPGVGMADKVLTEGDAVVWYYVTDYTQDTDRDEGSAPKPDAPKPELPFSDVGGHWASQAIRYCYENGLMRGTGPTTFSPDAPLSRAMLVTILFALEGRPGVAGDIPFTDVSADAWYSGAVIWAAGNAIVSGCGDGTFAPHDALTREQIAAILLAYSRYKGYDIDREHDLTSYTDAAEISVWALPALEWAVAEGLLSGRGENTLAPAGEAARGEAAAILMHYLENIK